MQTETIKRIAIFPRDVFHFVASVENFAQLVRMLLRHISMPYTSALETKN